MSGNYAHAEPRVSGVPQDHQPLYLWPNRCLLSTVVHYRGAHDNGLLYICTNYNWGGACTTIGFDLDECIRFPKFYQREISSYGPKAGHTCTLYLRWKIGEHRSQKNNLDQFEFLAMMYSSCYCSNERYMGHKLGTYLGGSSSILAGSNRNPLSRLVSHGLLRPSPDAALVPVVVAPPKRAKLNLRRRRRGVLSAQRPGGRDRRAVEALERFFAPERRRR
ncbi:hypothetical protein B0H13DRAFT_2281581 [Mycena leptocephala]|nr:hypothetical protein B0H13DRAFT_2281581 [Mycena leptocephala]